MNDFFRSPQIINIEGIDGTGKATVSKKLREIFEGQGKKVFNLHFPCYNTPTGDLVKSFLTGNLVSDPVQVDPILASMYYVTDRLTYYKNNPQIFTDYDVLIFDRSYMSNFFFQTAKYSMISKSTHIDNILTYITTMYPLEIFNSPLGNFEFDIKTFMLYHPDTNTNFRLMENRGGASDLHESNKKYLEDIQKNAFKILEYQKEGYKKFDQFPAYKFKPIQCSSIDGELKTIENIANEIIGYLE